MAEQLRFTPIQQRIIDLLSDGMPHDLKELLSCLNDNLSSSSNLKPHLAAIRKILRPRGEDIICQFLNRKRQYRQVRLLSSAYDGYQ